MEMLKSEKRNVLLNLCLYIKTALQHRLSIDIVDT